MIIGATTQGPTLAGLLFGLAVVVGCGTNGSASSTDSASAQQVAPIERAAMIETTGCGYASGRVGSGVALGGGLVITVAHLVVHASRADLSIGDVLAGDGTVVAVDLERDLALLRLADGDLADVTTASAVKGDRGSVVGAAVSGTVPFQVRGVVELTIEDVLGNGRHSRLGYQLDADTTDGDSGAGVYDSQGRLIGIVFATSDGGAVTWATAATEIEDFLSTTSRDDVYDLCN